MTQTHSISTNVIFLVISLRLDMRTMLLCVLILHQLTLLYLLMKMFLFDPFDPIIFIVVAFVSISFVISIRNEVEDPIFEIQNPTTIDVFNANNSNDNDDVSNFPSFQSFKFFIVKELGFVTFIHEH